MKLARWLAVTSMALFLGVTTVTARERAPGQPHGGKGRGQEFRQQFRQTMMGIRQKEQQLLQQNPELREAVSDIDKQIRELQEQRQEKLAAADPELAELYQKVNGMREKAKRFREGKGREGRGKVKGRGKHHGEERDDD